MARFDSVDDYLASLDPPKGDTLRSVIGLILGEFPELECKIAWNVPQVHRDGAYVFGVSASKNHLGLAPWSVDVIERFAPRLDADGYVVKQHLFNVPVDWDVDGNLVVDLVTARLSELDRDDG
jgi:uncharacterized protein